MGKNINLFLIRSELKSKICRGDTSKEITPILMRRIVLPMYIPVIALICSFLLMKNQRAYSNKISIFIYSFLLLLLTEITIRYTGLNNILKLFYIIAPIILISGFYSLLLYKFSREMKY